MAVFSWATISAFTLGRVTVSWNISPSVTVDIPSCRPFRTIRRMGFPCAACWRMTPYRLFCASLKHRRAIVCFFVRIHSRFSQYSFGFRRFTPSPPLLKAAARSPGSRFQKRAVRGCSRQPRCLSLCLDLLIQPPGCSSVRHNVAPQVVGTPVRGLRLPRVARLSGIVAFVPVLPGAPHAASAVLRHVTCPPSAPGRPAPAVPAAASPAGCPAAPAAARPACSRFLPFGRTPP